jgi:hypothetical protein
MSSNGNWNSKACHTSRNILAYLDCVFANLENSSKSELMKQKQYVNI